MNGASRASTSSAVRYYLFFKLSWFWSGRTHLFSSSLKRSRGMPCAATRSSCSKMSNAMSTIPLPCLRAAVFHSPLFPSDARVDMPSVAWIASFVVARHSSCQAAYYFRDDTSLAFTVYLRCARNRDGKPRDDALSRVHPRYGPLRAARGRAAPCFPEMPVKRDEFIWR